jgi:hypothetical protein
VANITKYNNNDSSLGYPQSSQSFSVQAFDGKVNAGYRNQTFENGSKQQFYANVGGKSGVTFTHEKCNYDF